MGRFLSWFVVAFCGVCFMLLYQHCNSVVLSFGWFLVYYFDCAV